ncbi:MAG TPA: phosphate ABC transporter substrate-binding protein PstS [Nocardioidaceae bacterium]|nr:phosphate ABC transporter substrate-binding protein PstS [Nocardioidaceae bacterium]
MKTQSRQRFASITGVALVGVLALSGCGSDNNPAAPAAGNGAVNAADCPTGTLNGEGSSAQKNAIEQAISDFQATCSDATINYNPTGSGAGIKQFIAGQVNFAGSDSALKDEAKPGSTSIEQADADKTCGSPAWNLPMVTGPIAVGYNVKGVDKLILTPAVTAKIFSGAITTWNDAAIAAINPGATLPAEAIKVFFRSDESGTTENFTKYLHAAAAADWAADPAKKWSGKGEGKEKSAGVANAVKSTEGGITYAEWSYAKDNKLGIAQIDNGAGPVELTGEAVGKAVAVATQAGSGNNIKLQLDYATKEAGAYPILLVTYEIVCSKAKDPAKATLVKEFLNSFAAADEQKKLQDIGYAPLPSAVQTKVTSAIGALS